MIRVDVDYFGDFPARLNETSVDNVDLCELNAAKVIDKLADYYRECLQWK